MAFCENGTLEYKRQYTPDLKKEVVAFANTAGGKIYIGVDDDGTPVGDRTRTPWCSSSPTPCGMASARM